MNGILDEIKKLEKHDQIFIMKELIAMVTGGHISCDGPIYTMEIGGKKLKGYCPNNGILMCMYCKSFICCGDNDDKPCVDWKLCEACGTVACKECREHYDKYLKEPNDDWCDICRECFYSLS